MAFVAVTPLSSRRHQAIGNSAGVVGRRHRDLVLRCQVTPEESTEAGGAEKGALGTEADSGAQKIDVCAGCGREGGPVGGCDGNGRIIGGLGAVVKWWPIKAYRPCPDFLNANKKYRRAGQSLDEIAFGRKGQGDDKSITERLSGK